MGLNHTKHDDISFTCSTIRSTSVPILHKSCIYVSMTLLTFPYLLLLLSGDIEVNPGPFPTPTVTHSTSTCNSSTITPINTSFDPHRFTFVHLNIQSLTHKVHILETELHNHTILSFTETWLHEDNISSDIDIHNFQTPFCRCRKTKTGGGVAVYVKDNYLQNAESTLNQPRLSAFGWNFLWVVNLFCTERFIDPQTLQYLYGVILSTP